MSIKAVYDTQDQIPEAYRDLFAERDGKFVLSVEGAYTESDVSKLKKALETERGSVTQLRKDLAAWSSLGDEVSPQGVKEMQARVQELEDALAASSAKGSESVDAAVKERMGPLERQFQEQLAAVTKDRDKWRGAAEQHETLLRNQTFERLVTSTANDKIVPGAAADLIFRAKSYGFDIDENGELIAKKPDGTPRYSEADPTSRLTFSEFIDKLLPREAPHLFKRAQGTGDQGGGEAGSFARPWGQLTEAEKTKEIRAAGARGEDIASFVAQRTAAAIRSANSAAGK